MRKISTSTRIYIILVLMLAVSNAIQVLMPSYQNLVPSATLPAPLYVIALLNAGIAILLAPFFGNSPPDKYPAAMESGEKL